MLNKDIKYINKLDEVLAIKVSFPFLKYIAFSKLKVFGGTFLPLYPNLTLLWKKPVGEAPSR